VNLISFSTLRQKLGGRGRTTIYRDMEAGRVPQPTKIGGRLYWDEQAVDDCLKNHSLSSGVAPGDTKSPSAHGVGKPI